MANNVKVGIIIDDKGTLKKVTNDTKKAGAAADNYSRKQKGVAGATSNSTKAFSKMSQGMGGVLVPAYAAFAAQMFALTAAFGFFKRAGDLKTLQAGQLAYAAGTGIAMKSMTKDIMEATGAQVAFRDAAQATAIGTAAGLNADQLVRLGKAAKDASAVLGRDVTDSFNRLIRGVTKAEPELLDELGIILRLKKATEDYGKTINKSADDLTAFERSQAVVNEVLEQSERKYSKILDLTGGGSVNSFAQLSVALDEVVMKIQSMLIPVAEALAKVLTDLPLLAGASFALLLTGPLKAMGFNMVDIAAKTKVTADIQKTEYNKIKAAIDAANLSQKDYLATASRIAGQAQKGTTGKGSTLLAQVGRGEKLGPRDSTTFMRATDAALKTGASKNGVVIKGIYKGVAVSIVSDMQKAYTALQAAGDITEVKAVKNTVRIKGAYLGASAAIKGFGAFMLTWGSKILGALGWIGLIVTAGTMIYNAFKGAEPAMNDAAKATDHYRSKIKELNEEFKMFVETQRILTEDGAGRAGFGAAIGNLAGSAGPAAMQQALKDARIAQKIKAQKVSVASGPAGNTGAAAYNIGNATDEQEGALGFITKQTDALDLFEDRFGKMKAFTTYREMLKDVNASAEDTEAARQAVVTLGQALNNISVLSGNSGKSMSTFTQGLAPLNTAEKAMKDFNAELANYEKLGMQGELTLANKESIKLIKDNIKFLKDINDLKHNNQMAEMKHSRVMAKAQNQQHPVLKSLAVLEANKAGLVLKQVSLAQEYGNIQANIARNGGTITDGEQRRLDTITEELIGLGQKEGFLDKELSLKLQLKEIEMSLFELKSNQKLVNVSKQLLDFDKEGLSIAKRRQAITKAENARAVKAASRGPGFGGLLQNSSYVQAKSAASAASDGLAQTETDIKADFALRKKLQEEDNNIQIFKMQILQMEMQKLKIERETLAKQFRLQAAKEPAGSEAAKALLAQADSFGSTEMDKVLASINTIIASLPERGTALIKLIDEEKLEALTAAKQVVTDLITKAADLEPLTAGLKDLGDSVFQSMSGAFAAIVTGTQSAKQAFSSMAMSILADLSSMIAKQLVFSMFQGTGFGKFMGIPGVRTGGIMSDGEKVSGYATGGVARGPGAGYPAVLHGTEAVVPLPNGRSIPVEMQGGGGSQNNIVVNVSTDGQTSNSGSTGPDMDKLGGAIAEAVQKELHAQKRSGGILNPYGVA
tara:strand:- start:3286 stop:6927 length:3642 start_codon:yes stop_codon:yes gene_type:complete